MDCRDSLPLIGAKLDGELDAETAREFEAHLAGCPNCRNELAAQRALSGAIRSHARRDAAPPELRWRVMGALRRSEKPRWYEGFRAFGSGWNPAALAASFALTVIVTAAVTRDIVAPTGPDGAVQQVVADHVRSLMADHLTDVLSTDQHTVKPWFNGRIDLSPPVADLASSGFPLVGGRLDYLEGRPVAALIYRHEKHIINVLVTPGRNDGAAPMTTAYDGYNLIHLTAGSLGLWVVSDLNAAELHDFAIKLRDATSDASPAKP